MIKRKKQITRKRKKRAQPATAAAADLPAPIVASDEKAPLPPAEQYVADVLSGKIVVNKWVRKAVERHVRDLDTADARGLRFDRERAERAIRFFKYLRHSKGEWGPKNGKPGQVFTPEPWQQFILWVIFGWYVTTGEKAGCRRFRMAYVKVARKNGKSTFAAGIGLYLFIADGEPGAEVYTAATKREQARIVHSEAVTMVRSSPDLARRIMIFKDNMNVPATRSKFEPLGADEGTDDGRSPSGAIIDELHAHKTRGCLDVLDSGTGARRQPLIFNITTAGAGRVGVDQDMHAYAEKILDGRIEDDSFFAIIYAIDEEDDWRDEKCWIKANPNLGVSVKLEDLRAKVRKAVEMPTARNEVLQKHMNRQTEQSELWLPMEKWDACKRPIPDDVLSGRRCFGGMDLSSKLDIAGYGLVFPPIEEDPLWRVKIRLYVPEASAETREREANVPYATWARQGFLKLTEGNVVDYEFIKADIREDAKRFQIEQFGYDPWNATQIALQLQDEGLIVVEVNQGYRSLSEPSKELEKIIVELLLGHDGNPVLDWMASNVAVERDPAGNIKPSKKHSSEKIDGIVMMVIGIARALLNQIPAGSSDMISFL